MSSHRVQPSVLIVEDEPMVLASLKFTLETEQFEVVTCSSPVRTLSMLPDRDFSVIISD